MQNSLAYIFPAFTTRYTGKEITILNNSGFQFKEKLYACEKQLNLTLSDFDINHRNYLNDELKNQVLAYIFSTSFSDVLRTQHHEPAYVSGFSMGLYAALYQAGAVDFETGLQLIYEVFLEVKQIMRNLDYGMISVVGFPLSELEAFIQDLRTTEIVIQNGEFSFVLSGANHELNPLAELLQEKGAVHMNIFKVSVAYHSKILQPHQEAFSQIVKKHTITKPNTPIVSMVDNSVIDTIDKVASEITVNIVHPLNFMNSITYMQQLGINEFIEVGAGNSLLKSSKFIKGDFTFKAVSKHKLIV